MRTIASLQRAAYGVHSADQIALIAVPLVAASVFGASPETIGVLVACQSLAHLAGSLPFGVLVDRAQQRSLAIAATLISAIGFSGAAWSVFADSLIGFGAMITAAGFGIVLFVLTAISILPRAVPPAELAQANAAIEIPRAICSFAVPLAVGLLISDTTAPFISRRRRSVR